MPAAYTLKKVDPTGDGGGTAGLGSVYEKQSVKKMRQEDSTSACRRFMLYDQGHDQPDNGKDKAKRKGGFQISAREIGDTSGQ